MNIFSQFFSRRASPRQLQWLIWGTIFLVNFFSYLPMDGLLQSFIYTILNTLVYAIIIYGNISFLFPWLYRPGRIGWYILASIVLLAAIGFLKTWISQLVYNTWFAKKYYALTWQTIVYVTVGCAVVFILSFVFRIALAYFALKQQTQQIQEQKSLAELNLLKSQVQPHFLFNTLNNIYYEASGKLPARLCSSDGSRRSCATLWTKAPRKRSHSPPRYSSWKTISPLKRSAFAMAWR